MDTSAAEKMPGVQAIYHYGNIGKLFRVAVSFGGDDWSMIDETRPPFEDEVIRYYGQYVAVVVADGTGATVAVGIAWLVARFGKGGASARI